MAAGEIKCRYKNELPLLYTGKPLIVTLTMVRFLLFSVLGNGIKLFSFPSQCDLNGFGP